MATIDGHYGIVGSDEGWVAFDDSIIGGQIGVFAGYNWQQNNIVYGVEAE